MSKAPDLINADLRRSDHNVDAELLWLTFKRTPLNMVMQGGISLLLIYLWWTEYPAHLLISWVVAMYGSILAAGLLWLSFRRVEVASAPLARWRRLFVLQNTISGVGWSVAPVLLMRHAGKSEVELFVGLLWAVCAVAISTLSSQRQAMTGFIIGAMLPAALAAFLIGDGFHILMGLTLLGGMGCLLAVGRISSKAVAALIEAKYRMRAIFNTALDAIIGVSAEGRINDWNHRAEVIFGWTRAQALGLPLEECIIPSRLRGRPEQDLSTLLSSDGRFTGEQRIEMLVMRQSGAEFPVEMAVTSLRSGNTRQFTLYLADISARKAAEAEMRIAAVAFAAEKAMVITDPAGTILRVNPAFTQLMGYTAAEAVGQPMSLLRSGRQDKEFYAELWRRLQQDGDWQGEIWNKHKDQCVGAHLLTITAVKAPELGTTHYVGSYADIELDQGAQARIHQLAYYDQLTGLPNRRLLQDRLAQALLSAHRSKLFGAVFLINIDRFKEVNDTHGHVVGDQLLVDVAQRLRELGREGDSIARLGSDEFVLLMESLGHSELEAAHQAEALGEKVLASLGLSYRLNGLNYQGCFSIGVALLSPGNNRGEEILNRVNLAMHQVKAAGGKALRFFDPKVQEAINARLALERALREAISGGQLVLHYQAQASGAGQIAGAEVLVRWQHPSRGMVPPNEFIQLAEETGLILPLGLWVLETACTQLASWASQPLFAKFSLAVNVSAVQFQQSDFVEQVLGVLARTGAQPGLLKLELTESMLVADVESVIAKMLTLKDHGVCFSLDDFGTGYSSLSYLSRLPLDQLKIDSSFVMELEHSTRAATICEATISLAHGLKLKVVAEGVETQAQSQILTETLGCDLIQGYCFSRPLPVAGFEALVAQR